MESIKQYVAQGIVNGLKTAATSAFIGIVNGSYWICLTVGLLSIIFYACGFKKAGKWAGLSVVIYFILQSIKVAL